MCPALSSKAKLEEQQRPKEDTKWCIHGELFMCQEKVFSPAICTRTLTSLKKQIRLFVDFE